MRAALVGTSGWSYDHWAGRFYPAGLPDSRRFEFYASHFPTVEVNFSFYRLPSEKTIGGWAAHAPQGFVFAMKGSRLITHALRLRNCREATRVFLERVRPLGAHLGPILWQLPPNMEKDVSRLVDFVELVRELWEAGLRPRHATEALVAEAGTKATAPNRTGAEEAGTRAAGGKPAGAVRHERGADGQTFAGLRQAFEFRHSSWFDGEVRGALKQAGAALVAASHPGTNEPTPPTASFVYCRFHGLTGFVHDYSPEELAPWADYIRRALRNRRDAFAYFNNDGEAKAPKNAAELEGLLS